MNIKTLLLVKLFAIKILILIALICSSCGSASNNKEDSLSDEENMQDSQPSFHHVIVNERTIFNDIHPQPSVSFVVISKKYTDLSVYASVDNDTILLVRYPVCLSRVKGQKEKRGDMKTPECTMDNPFLISQIQDASDWHHDFGDGRGSILSYGHWFLRLSTPPHSGIGIHGSTNNAESVPGRDSEGCIRMRDADIIHFKENYAYIGMKVIIMKEEQESLPFEQNAIIDYK